MVVILSTAIVGMYWAVFLLARLGFGYSSGLSALGALTASAPSSAFIGATVLGYLYGAKADITVAIASIIIVVALVPVTIVILSLEQSERPAYRRHRKGTAEEAQPPRSRTELGPKLLDAAKQSVIWLPLLGFALVLADVPVPRVAANSLALLGHASAGVALFAAGIILAGYRVILSGPVLFLVLAKNVVQPALVLVAMLWLGYGHPILGEAVLTAALPPIALVVMLAVQYRVAARETASALFISTLGSLLTMSAFIAFLT